MNKYIIFFLILFTCLRAGAQDDVLENYINEGLVGNLEVKQKLASWEKSRWALKEARGLFMPELSLNARYTFGHGGRTIDIPVGDMLNDVYHTLNLITSQMYALGMADQVFPDTSLENQSISFIREREQETKLQLVQPLFSPQIFYNYKIQKELISLETVSIDNSRRNVVAEIKKTYFSWLLTQELISLVDNTLKDLDEVISINKSLQKNDKITIDIIYTLQAERDNLMQQRSEAQKASKMVAAYFNYLIDKPYTNDIVISNNYALSVRDHQPDDAVISAKNNREELNMLRIKGSAQDYVVKMNKYNQLPNLFAVVDYGFQGEEYKFTEDDDYILASFVMKWDLFKGLQNRAVIQQTILDRQITEDRIREVENQVSLQVTNSFDEMNFAHEALPTAESRFSNASRAFELVSKRYAENRSDMMFFQQYLESLEKKASAEKNLIETRFDFYIKYAEFERVAALYQLPKLELNK